MPEIFLLFYVGAVRLWEPGFRVMTIAFLIIGGLILAAGLMDFLEPVFHKYDEEHKTTFGIALLFLLMGALFILGGIIFFLDFNLIKLKGEQNIGEIVKIEYRYSRHVGSWVDLLDPNDRLSGLYRVHVQIGDEEFPRLLFWGLEVQKNVGDKIVVYNEPNKPRTLYSNANNEDIRLIFYGLLFFIPGFIAMRSMVSRLN